MSSLYEIVNRANQIASGRIADGNASPVLDNEMTTEALFNPALRYVAADIVKKGLRLQDITRRHTITFTDGTGALPDTVIRSAVRFASMPEKSFASYLSPEDFNRKRFTGLMDYFTIENDSVYYKAAGITDFSGDAVFSFITLPEKDLKPQGFSKELDLSETVVDDVVIVMAGALTGEIPLQQLLNNQIY